MISSMLGWGLTGMWGVSPRHQFMQRSAHPGSKPDKTLKAKARREKAKRHQRTAPECCGQRAKGRR